MVSSSSERWSDNECLGLEIDRLRLVCEILARGAIRYRRGNAGEVARTLPCATSEKLGDESACTADCLDEENQ
jgi:hypothetical protein